MDRNERLRNMLDAIIDGNDEQAKTEFHSYFAEKTREKVNEDVNSEPEPESGKKEHEDYESRNYRQVVDAVADHFNLDPKQIDNQDEKTRKKIYNMIDNCWDSKDNKVPDTCPININIK